MHLWARGIRPECKGGARAGAIFGLQKKKIFTKNVDTKQFFHRLSKTKIQWCLPTRALVHQHTRYNLQHVREAESKREGSTSVKLLDNLHDFVLPFSTALKLN